MSTPAGGEQPQGQPNGQPSGQPSDHPYGDGLYQSEAQPSDAAQYPPQYPTQYASQYPPQYPSQYPPPYPPQYAGQYAGQYPYGAAPESPQGGSSRRRRPRRRTVLTAGVGALAAAAIFGAGVATGSSVSVSGTGLAAAPSIGSGSSGSGSSGSGSSGSGFGSGSGSSGSGSSGGSATDPFGQYPFGSNGSSGSGSTGSTAQATSKQSVGVVDIYTELSYQGAEAAGTGIVLTSDGEILTNNHVINGATAIKVVVVSTQKSYTAKVVGTVPTKDVALIKLVGASGLKTANLGDSSKVAVGDKVTGVGNAGGNGGTPSAAAGNVTATNKTITASDEDGSAAETLHGVIVTDAPIQAGDSGGPLYNSNDEIVGIDTAASTSGQSQGFAIPINTAMSLVSDIRSGVQTSSVHLGYPGFMGVSIQPANVPGALVYQVVSGGPAAKAGIVAGDVITKVGSTTIRNQTQLQKAVSAKDPGSKLSITYTDQKNASHTVTVTLATGPAD